jgi:hypothetical protein
MPDKPTDSDKLNTVLEHFDSLHKRLDEAAEERKADRARIDAACARMDSYDQARKDAAEKEPTPAELAARHDAELPRFTAAQIAAERVHQAFGDSAGAPRWLNGETVPQYRRRLLQRYKQHSPAWKDVDLSKISDETALGVAETQIYADAHQASMNGSLVPPNMLREITSRDQSGRQISRFVGADDAAWSQFTFFPRQIRAG